MVSSKTAQVEFEVKGLVSGVVEGAGSSERGDTPEGKRKFI